MRFELTEALLDEILFSMENQDTDSVFDTLEGCVIMGDNYELEDQDDDPDSDDRYISLPEWSPQDGFRLMEHFTSGLRNPMIREELTAALNRGKGVFRAFKNVIGQYPETEKLWYRFKDMEMKREVIAWYNAYRENWGLELIGAEPEDTSSLILEDFLLREGTDADYKKAAALHKICLDAGTDTGPDAESGSTGSIHAVFESMNKWIFPGDLCFVAETMDGDFSGYICAAGSAPSTLHICALEIIPEYRGLGLGKALLGRFLEKAGTEQIRNITADLSAGKENFSRMLILENFKPCVQRYVRTG